MDQQHLPGDEPDGSLQDLLYPVHYCRIIFTHLPFTCSDLNWEIQRNKTLSELNWSLRNQDIEKTDIN